jgi:hypothetical protein
MSKEEQEDNVVCVKMVGEEIGVTFLYVEYLVYLVIVLLKILVHVKHCTVELLVILVINLI